MGNEPVLLAGGAVHKPLTASDLRFPPILDPREETEMAGTEKVYLPQQNVRRGVAGYKQSKKTENVTVVDENGRTVPQEKKK
jgi:hypothetical protein